MDEGTQAWLRMVGQPPTAGAPAVLDPQAFWKPFMDQGIAAWSKVMTQGPASPELMTQWKQFLDQWIAAWSRALEQAMGTESFAKLLGKQLEGFLAGAGPAKKAAAEQQEARLAGLGMPSRAQVTAYRPADRPARGEDRGRGGPPRRRPRPARGPRRGTAARGAMIGLTIDQIEEGDEAEIVRVAAERDIAGFVDAVGDDNPIHSDPAYAADSMFKERIAPGIWTAGLISAVIGTRLPGPGTIYVSQDLRFLRPVKLGDAIRARVQVIETSRERNRVRLRTVCRNQRGEEVLTGEALVMPSRTPVVYRRPAGPRRPVDGVGARAVGVGHGRGRGPRRCCGCLAAAGPPGIPPPQRAVTAFRGHPRRPTPAAALSPLTQAC